MTDNADLGRGYAPVVTCARHHQALHVGGVSAHPEAGVFELTSPRDIRMVTADIDEHLAERISRTTFAPDQSADRTLAVQNRVEPDSQYCRAQVSHRAQRVARLAQRLDLTGGAL